MVARYTVWVWQTYVEVGRVDNWCLAGHGILGNRTVSLFPCPYHAYFFT